MDWPPKSTKFLALAAAAFAVLAMVDQEDMQTEEDFDQVYFFLECYEDRSFLDAARQTRSVRAAETSLPQQRPPEEGWRQVEVLVQEVVPAACDREKRFGKCFAAFAQVCLAAAFVSATSLPQSYRQIV